MIMVIIMITMILMMIFVYMYVAIWAQIVAGNRAAKLRRLEDARKQLPYMSASALSAAYRDVLNIIVCLRYMVEMLCVKHRGWSQRPGLHMALYFSH